jgi:hypothetical protein
VGSAGAEDHQLPADDVHIGLSCAELGGHLGEDADVAVDTRIKNQRIDLGNRHADGGCAG